MLNDRLRMCAKTKSISTVQVGKIRDTASCCTWFWCCMLLPFGLIPGIIAFCCCCRHPKCSHCGYTVD